MLYPPAPVPTTVTIDTMLSKLLFLTVNINKIQEGKNMNPRSNLEEDLKDFGWGLYYSDEEDKSLKTAGLLFIIYSHYDRSLFSFERRKNKNHPKIEEYAGHWLAANADRYDKETVNLIKNHFGIAESPLIPKGKSYVDPEATGV